MADKDLKSLTIDGTTFRNLFTDSSIGKFVTKLASNVSCPANVAVTGANETITEPGLYQFMTYGSFSSATTTGVTRRSVAAYVDYPQGRVESQPTSVFAGSNDPVAIQYTQPLELAADQVPTTITALAGCSRACTLLKLDLYIVKLAKYPGVGGVVKRFKNLICYRSLNFGKAVA